MSAIQWIFDMPDTTVDEGVPSPSGQPPLEEVSGEWYVQDGYARSTATDASNPILAASAGAGNVDLRAAVSDMGGDAIYARVVDADNWLRLRVQRTSIPHYQTQYEWMESYSHGNHSGDTGIDVIWGSTTRTVWGYSSTSAPSFPNTINVSHDHHDGTAHSSAFYRTFSASYTGNSNTTYVGSSTSYAVVLERCVNGTVTQIDNATVSAPSELRLLVQDTTVQAFVNDADDPTIDTTDNVHGVAARHGIGRASPSSNPSELGWLYVDGMNAPPNAPTSLSPADKPVDKDGPQRLRWKFSDDDAGDSQSAYTLRYRLYGTTEWTTVSGGASQYHDFAAGTFTEGEWEWQVRTTDNAGLVGEWSSIEKFTAATVPGDLSFSNLVNNGTVSVDLLLVEWSAESQNAYELRRVADVDGSPDESKIHYSTSGAVTSSSRAAMVPFETDGRFEHVQLRIRSNGLWSDWISVRILVSYTRPAKPALSISTDTPADGAMRIIPSLPVPQDTQPQVTGIHLIRRETKSGKTERIRRDLSPPPVAIDLYTCRSGVDYEFQIIALGDNDTTSASEYIGAAEAGDGTIYYGGSY